jgi:hypothetical protein
MMSMTRATPRSRRRLILVLALALWGMVHASSLQAADTVETWAVGATDVDYYVGADGLRRSRVDRAVFTDIMFGYGLVERLSAYLGTTMEGNGYLSSGAPSLYTGLFGTVIDSRHVDVDLFIDMCASGAGMGDLAFTPAFELNVDADPNMATWGSYLRVAVPLIGQSEPGGSGEPGDPGGAGNDRLRHDTLVHVEPVLGAYWAPRPGHQLLIEVDAMMHAKPSPEERRVDLGGVALGYNLALSDAIELISQVHVDVPLGDESVDLGAMVGIIATLPGAG